MSELQAEVAWSRHMAQIANSITFAFMPGDEKMPALGRMMDAGSPEKMTEEDRVLYETALATLPPAPTEAPA